MSKKWNKIKTKTKKFKQVIDNPPNKEKSLPSPKIEENVIHPKTEQNHDHLRIENRWIQL